MTYEEFIQEWRGETDNVICHTSGSTGEPQTISLPKRELWKSASRTNRFFNLGDRSHYHSCIAADYIGGKMMAVRSEVSGGILTYETPSNRPLKDYSGGPVDLLAVVPSQMIHILDNEETMPPIRNIIVGGAPIPAGLRKRIAESGLNVWETYGMTETCSHIALRKIDVCTSGFSVLDGIEISKTIDGCLKIRLDGWKEIETHDMVEIAEDGTFEILGRSDSMIITGGKKVNPLTIERALEEEFGCEILVTSEPDEKWGEKIVYLIEDTDLQVNDTAIKEYARREFKEECHPKEIRHMKLPRTANGKKKRR
ncbi:MAG: AMP-binding protein [Muribaculaceae bacterium]|nr:AMP-binding protein [Muribaculaceae bacterium]